MKNVKVIKAITELALECMVYYKENEINDWNDGELWGFCKSLAIVRGTDEDHEWDRIARLYKMRKKKGEY